MIHVDCPSCNAPYELDERRLPKGGMQMRCPKCGTSFPVKPPAAAEAPAAAPATPARKPPLAPAFPGLPKPPAPAAPAPSAFGVPKPPAPAAPPAAAPSAFSVPKPPAPAASPFDDLDLDLDLPVPKRSGAAVFDDLELDLPAPKRPVAASATPLDEILDLPAPKLGASKAASPNPPRAAAPKAAPVAPAEPPLDAIVDLPAPRAVPGASPRRPIAMPAAFDEVDLPAPKTRTPAPAPNARATPFDDFELDLPAPRVAAARSDLDLPTPIATGPSAPALGGALDDLDLPSARISDLPTPRSRGALDDLDLPSPRISDLPAPRHGGALDALDLPTPRAAGPVPSARRNPFDDLLGDAPSDDDLGFDLPLPTPESLPPASPAARPQGGFGLDVPPPRSMAPALDDDDDLALPEPRARGASAPPARATKQGVGSTGFGELDLGEGGGEEELEFAGLAEEESAPEPAGGFADLPDPDAAAPTPTSAPPAAGGVPRRARPAASKKSKGGRSLVALAVVLVLLVGAGAALHFTPYGLFGIYALERYLPAAGSEAEATRVARHAEARASSDTVADVRAALGELAAARRATGLNRVLLVRSLVHEALYQIRFGGDAASSARAARIRARLDERAGLVPDMAVARAADELRRGVEPVSLTAALALAPDDAYVELLAGEDALRRGQGEEAKRAFGEALSHGAGARAAWGLARAAIHLGDPASEAAVDATLAASPSHVSALAAKAELVFARGAADEALSLARRAAGLEPVGGAPLRGATRERAAAFAMLGRLEEARSHRAEARAAYERAFALDSERVDALVGAARVLLREGQGRDALARFDAAVEVLGQRGADAPPALVREAQLGRAEALLRVDRPADARVVLEGLAAVTPDDADVTLYLGRTLAQLGESEAAVTALRRAIELAPERFEAYMALAQHHFASDQPTEATEVLRTAQARVEPTAEVHRMLGESLIRRNELVAAEEELRRALALDADDRGAMFGLGVVARRGGRLDEAEQIFDRLAAIDPTYPGMALERASLYEARGQSEQAVEAFERALERSPEDPELKLRLAAAQVAAGRLDDAEALLDGLASADPPSAMALYYHGRVAFSRGALAQAVDRFRRAIALDHERVEFHVHLAWAYFERGELAAASSEVATAIDLDDGAGDAYWVRARIAVRTGRVRDALEDSERALRRNPTRYDAYAVMGDALEQLGRGDDAVEAYETAVRHRPEIGEWWYKLGRLRLDANERDGALAAVTRASAIGDAASTAPAWLADAHRVKAEVHRLRRESALAERHYERYLALAPATAIDVADVERRLAELRRNR